jgi:hypothetical protein
MLALALALFAGAAFVAGFIAFTALAAEFTAFAAVLIAVLAVFRAEFTALAVLAGSLFAFIFVFVFALLAASPHAIPRAPITRTADRAITFFIKSILLSSSKIRSNYVAYVPYLSFLEHTPI